VEDLSEILRTGIRASISAKQQMLDGSRIVDSLAKVINKVVDVYGKDGKVLFCGNGGSAADAQHLAAELSGRYYFDRPPLNAEAMHVNTSYLTAVANDYSYEEVYARYLRGVGQKGDVLMAFSTSGNSCNVVRAIEVAKEMGIFVVGFTGDKQGEMDGLCDIILKAPSKDTARIQECHIMLGHLICEQVESQLFKS
tara:strand:+ start:1707 stop:2294 length:588 start_codon:yes stop_codon:yes gene_type:complete